MKECKCLCHDKDSQTHGSAYKRNECWCYGCDGCRELGIKTIANYKPFNNK